jgi:succinate-acetate transporter protein
MTITPGKLFGYGIVFAILTGLLRLLAANVFNTSNIAVDAVLWVVLVVIAVATSRRLGVINYLEAMVTAVLWLVFSLTFDALCIARFITPSLWQRTETYVGYAVGMLAIFLFHQKRHVAIRRERAQK